jgi:hypothetical protein
MPPVTLRLLRPADNAEERLSEYICDWPGCPNVAEHLIGVMPGLRALSMVCREHASLIAAKRRRS